jgi:hypothetical protein
LAELVRARRRRRLESSGEPFEARHATLFKIKVGLYRFMTSRGAAGDPLEDAHALVDFDPQQALEVINIT